jgi:hypothetical protein
MGHQGYWTLWSNATLRSIAMTEKTTKKKYILIVSANVEENRQSFMFARQLLGERAKLCCTDTTIEDNKYVYIFRAPRDGSEQGFLDFKSKIMGMEVSQVIIKDNVSSLYKRLINGYVRIRQ